MSDRVLYDVGDGVATITLNRPEVLNAFDIEMLQEIHDRAGEAEQDDRVAVVVVKGAGRAFCTGADMKEIAVRQRRESGVQRGSRGTYLFWTLNKATIAQIHGYAVAGGMFLAVMSDITIAAAGTKIGYPEVRFGGPVDAHPYNWLVGAKKTKEWLYTGRLFDADEALRHGLINQVVPAEELESTVRELAGEIVQLERKNPGYVRATKALINGNHPRLTDPAMPYWLRNNQAIDEYRAVMARSQTEFFETIAESGFEAGMDRMHGAGVQP